MAKTTKRTCFIVTALGGAATEVRKHADQMFEYVLAPVLGDGFEIFRSDKIAQPGPIDHQIVSHLLEDDLVVADLSIDNTNVYYELATRHATKRPIIHLMAPGQTLPFDVHQLRAIEVDLHDLDSVKQAKEAFVKQVEWLEVNPEVESPISIGTTFRALQQSTDPQVRLETRVLAAIEDLGGRLSRVESGVRRVLLDSSRSGGLTVRPPGGGLQLLDEAHGVSLRPSDAVKEKSVMLDEYVRRMLAQSEDTKVDDDSLGKA